MMRNGLPSWRTLLLVAAAALLLAGCAAEWKGTPYENPQPAGDISGTNWDGQPFTLTGLKGKAVVLFFGYTNCPDVCPTTLAEMRSLHENLGANADKTAIVFVSVDPDRDTVARLAEYIPTFDKAFYGVHVDPISLEDVKKAYGVVAEKDYYNGDKSSDKYSVTHTARQYLVGPRGNLIVSYVYGTPEADIRADIARALR